MLTSMNRVATAVARRGVMPQFQRRGLGTAKRGAEMSDLQYQWKTAKSMFTHPGITYNAFKHQVDATRIFVYGGLVAYLCFSFIAFPCKSSYWETWSPIYWPGNFYGMLFKGSNEIFLDQPEKVGTINAYDAYVQLSSKRRLDSEGREEDD